MTSSANNDSALVTMNMNNVEQMTFFGRRYEFNSYQQNIIRNQRAVFECGGFKFSISDNMSFIEKYDDYNNLIENFDCSYIDFIKKELQYRSKNEIKSNSYNILAYDSYLNEDKIYILYALKQKSFTANTIVEFIYIS